VHVNEMGLSNLLILSTKNLQVSIIVLNLLLLQELPLAKLELSLRRDERIMRFLTIKLDKYGVKYNEDRRSGKISAYKKKEARRNF
jgi:small subunit ribosomal protein S6